MPYDLLQDALMDGLLSLEERREELACPGAIVAHEIVVALHAVRETLGGQR